MEAVLKTIAALDKRWWATTMCILMLVSVLGDGTPRPRSWIAACRACRDFVVMNIVAFKLAQVLNKACK